MSVPESLTICEVIRRYLGYKIAGLETQIAELRKVQPMGEMGQHYIDQQLRWLRDSLTVLKQLSRDTQPKAIREIFTELSYSIWRAGDDIAAATMG